MRFTKRRTVLVFHRNASSRNMVVVVIIDRNARRNAIKATRAIERTTVFTVIRVIYSKTIHENELLCIITVREGKYN